MHIQYRTRNVYGNDLKYVVDPMIAAMIRILTDQKTIDDRQIAALEGLGHTFEQVI